MSRPSISRDTARDTARATSRDRDWEGVRLHVVTGKGGTGKTTVAAALALALAAGGRRTLLVECEGRQGLARLFDAPPLPYLERKVAVAPDGGMVYGLAIDAEEALLEYLDLYYHAGRAGRALRRFGAIDFATTIAPGVRDVLLTGKAYEATRRRFSSRAARTAATIVPPDAGDGNDKYVYDAVVMDAPPTGRIARFLNVNAEVAGLARVGPINKQAESIMRLIRSPATAVHFVALLEDMPVQETLDGIDEVRAFDLPLGAIIVNRAHETRLSPSALKAMAGGNLAIKILRNQLVASGLKPDDSMIRGLITEATDHATRVTTQRRLLGKLKSAHRPTYRLPDLDIDDIGRLYALAHELIAQGAA